jgi:glycerol-3-phosphate dehydrogenase
VNVVVSGKEFNIRAKCVVNATGPYTDFVRQLDDTSIRKICQPSSGVHVVLPDYYRLAVFKFDTWC